MLRSRGVRFFAFREHLQGSKQIYASIFLFPFVGRYLGGGARNLQMEVEKTNNGVFDELF